MTDRELLELAAKACGYDTSHPWNKLRLNLEPPVDALCIDGVSTGWDPLTDDGHALRLAVTLGIDIRLFHLFRWFKEDEPRHMDCLVDRMGRGFQELVGDDPFAATRRAIVRAAAEIGSKLPSNK